MRWCAFALAVLIGAPGLVSCAGARDATDKELSALRSDLAKLRSDQSRTQERLDALEIARGELTRPAGIADPTPAPVDSDRPDLDVVRLAPEPDPDATDATDADAPRPVVRSVGPGTGVVERGVKEKATGDVKKSSREKKKKP